MNQSTKRNHWQFFTGDGEPTDQQCSHVDQIRAVSPSAQGCEECLQLGDTWIHLRMCRICGHVGCCNESKNKHAMKHYHATGHAIAQSIEPGEDWLWCYADELYLEPG